MMDKIKKYKKLIVVTCLLLCMSCALTFAFLKSQSNALTNTFTPGSVETVIKEDDPKPNGSDIDKAPYVKNIGENDALVRMRVTMSPSELVDKLHIQLQMNTSWTYQDDGYYYYNKILKPGETTEPLFTKVIGQNIVVNGEFASELEGLEIAVYHETVQNLIRDNDKVIQAQSGNDQFAQRIWNLFDSLEK